MNNEELERLAKEWHDAELKIRPLQPFEDYYKSIRAFIAGYQAALDAERAKVKMLREALGHYSGPAFSGMTAREALSKLEDV